MTGRVAKATGLAGADAPEPPSRLGPSDGIPRAAFTPGPWRIGDVWGATENEDSIELVVLPHDAFDALEIFAKRRDHDSFNEFKANARLIAAAPELYAALEALLHGIDVVQLPAETAHAKFALAKARGAHD